ncbi:hypothetical protein [Geoalkalibacter halelectricus]|uniref:Oxidoreductase n=1 Tax=Geoalkalibacter halelectricus TaxID=2847045 RepID=A0ABY5ZT54_9BACT|nr:hypothetical protein [Geoalkalibacter halelectricus]MDO3380075.1 hypothetical protein [Geoalkalibacter halelectricus]UWZ80406.1 hypothetical protein L9S41_03125 [Geoalkalibacter halelectricus]
MEGSPRHNILEGLKALHAETFPKICGNCGAVFHSTEDYVRKTRKLFGNGWFRAADDGELNFVQMYRNCRCGSTLLVHYWDRRDDSEPGRRRREKFQRVLDQLVARGWDRDIARDELLKFLLGEKSSLLEIFLARLHN